MARDNDETKHLVLLVLKTMCFVVGLGLLFFLNLGPLELLIAAVAVVFYPFIDHLVWLRRKKGK